MKYSLLWIFIAWMLVSCNDFLEESSQDEVRPTTVEDLMQVMIGEAYPMETKFSRFLDHLTDDMECNGISGEETLEVGLENARPAFSWSEDMFEEMASVDGVDAWSAYYAKIMGCNVVLGYLDRVSGDIETKENMRGQALVLRGWYYFMLVNLFGQPYNVGNPEENLGVPLKLKMEVTDEFFARNTVAEVYEQIEKDLLEGVDLLERYNKSVSLYKVNYLVGKSILSRVYLYMEEWDKSLEYSNEVLAEKSELTSLASMSDLGLQSKIGIYSDAVGDEVIWKFGDLTEYDGSPLYATGLSCSSPYVVSKELMALYETSDNSLNYLDLRARLYYYYAAYFSTTTYMLEYYIRFGWKGGYNQKYAAGKGIRTAELYLNRTEVYVRKYMETGDDQYRKDALNDLNKLRENRYDIRNVEYMKVEITDPDELFEFYKNERRRELSFEGHRWFDLRRMGMPRIEHKYFLDATNVQTFVLEEKSPRYVLPIPDNARERNPLLVPSP